MPHPFEVLPAVGALHARVVTGLAGLEFYLSVIFSEAIGDRDGALTDVLLHGRALSERWNMVRDVAAAGGLQALRVSLDALAGEVSWALERRNDLAHSVVVEDEGQQAAGEVELLSNLVNRRKKLKAIILTEADLQADILRLTKLTGALQQLASIPPGLNYDKNR